MSYLFPMEVFLSMDDSMDPSGPRYHFYSVQNTVKSVRKLVYAYYHIRNDSTTHFQYVINGTDPEPVHLTVAAPSLCFSFLCSTCCFLFLTLQDVIVIVFAFVSR